MKFYIDFKGYCSIDADSKEEAKEKFWNGLQPPSEDCYDEVYEIECVEAEGGDF